MFPCIGEQPWNEMLFNNFQTLPYVSGLMGKFWTNILVYRSFSIIGTKSLKNWKLLDKSVPYLWQELGPCSLDWRTTIHWNIGLACCHRPWYIWIGLKIAKTTFQRMVVLQLGRQDSISCWNSMEPGSQSKMKTMKCQKIFFKIW